VKTSEFSKKVEKVDTGNYINSLTLKKVKDYLNQKFPRWKDFKRELVEYGDLKKKKVKKTIEKPIDCIFYNKLRLYKYDKTWAPARVFSYSHKKYKFCPFSYKSQIETVFYKSKIPVYIDTTSGEQMEPEVNRMIESIKYISHTGYGIPIQINGQNSMLSNTYKLNANHIIRKRNKLIYLFTEYYNNSLKELIEKGHTIKHLVLTVRHTKEYGFNGSKFFHSEILKKWNFLRKNKDFSKYVVGGFTSSEVTKGKNGWHNHLHIMIIQAPKVLDTKVREFITENWYNLTGSKRVRYENLYKYIYLNNGKKKKKYLNTNTYTTVDIIKSYLEMIKYTMDLKDIKLTAKDIGLYLNSSRYKRVFNRFGSLYGVKQLSLNYKSNNYDSYSKKKYSDNIIDSKEYNDYSIYSYEHKKLFKYKLLPIESKALLKDVYIYGYKILRVIHESKNKLTAIRSIQTIKNKGKPIQDKSQNSYDQNNIGPDIPIYINGFINCFDNVEI